MHKAVRFFQFLFLSGFILSFAAPDALAKTYQLDVSNNRLSADFENMPFSAIIDDIGAKTGIRFLFLGGAAVSSYTRPLSFKFESLPIRAALGKLLLDFNYSFISDGSDTIRQVFILGSKKAAGSLPKSQPPIVMAANQAPDINPFPQEGTQMDPGEEVRNEPPAEQGTVVAPPSFGGMSIQPASAQRVAATPPGAWVNPRTRIRRPTQWAVRKTK